MRTAVLLLAAGFAGAEQLAIRIVGQAQPNCFSIDDIVEGITRGLATDREKALALHRFGMAHMIHFNGPIEERNEYVNDPLKLIGVYGYALCGNNSCAMAGLYNRAGMKARTRSMPGHSVPEVWFEGRWNYIDTDMFGYVFLPDGKSIASVDDLVRDPDLFVRQTKPPDPFYPFDKKPDMASVFRNVKPSKNCHPYANAHLMNLALRTGEAATLYFRPRGRYVLTTIYPRDLGTVYKDYWVVGPVRRGSLAWCDEPPASYGNGVIEYAPDLRSPAFRAENPTHENVAPRTGRNLPALAAARALQSARLELDMTYPWVIAGLQNDLTNFDDDSEGAIVSGLFWRMRDADENRIAVSNDNGLTWHTVWQNRHLGAVPFRVDLTRWAKGRYHYRVRFEWVDSQGAGRVGIEQLKVETWVALSPMALPRLEKGLNRFEVLRSPRRTYYHESRWDRGGALQGEQLDNLALGGEPPALRPQDPQKQGRLTFRLGPDAVADEVRISLLARALGPMSAVRVALEMSRDQGRSWRELERYSPDPEHNTSHMWFNHRIQNASLAGADTRVRVTVSGAALEKVISNSALRAEPRASSTLKVTHNWREDGQDRTSSTTIPPGSGAAAYQVQTGGGKLLNQSLRIEAASAR